MNTESPNTPEERLLDELLREQSHGPDEAFLKQIESAVDAGTNLASHPSAKGNFSRYAIAASVLLAAGSGLWWWSPDKEAEPLVRMQSTEMRAAAPAQKEIIPGGPKKDLIAANDAAAATATVPTTEQSSLAPIQEQGESLDVVGGLVGNFDKPKEAIGTGMGSGLAAGPRGGLQEIKPTDSSLAANGGAGRESRDDSTISPAEPSDAMKRAESRRADYSRGGVRARIVPPAAVAPPATEMASSDPLGGVTFDKKVPLRFEETSSDRYGTFIEQPWKSPAADPLSTFSIDVDTASYSNIRRMIREGRQIPKDAVRIEECINAFQYHYPAPKGDAPFAVGATLADCPWAAGHQLVRVAIKGREIETNKRPASNLVFLIDVSGSMQSSDKLPLLLQSMETMIGQLDERDRVAIVVYAGKEGVALPSTRLDEEGRAKALATLSKLAAGGSTNGSAGITRAYEIATEQKIQGGVNRVILATDGDFNVGVTGQEALVSLVKDKAKSGVYLTVAGFGTGNLNDAMMDAITRDGNGNYFYIDSEQEGKKVFLQNLSGTLVTVAKDVKIQVEFNPAKVGGYRLIGYANRVLKNEDFNNDKVDAGDIGAGHTVTAFYEIAPPGEAPVVDGLKYQTPPEKSAAPATDEWLTVKLRHKAPDGDESRKIEFPLKGDALPLAKTDADFQFATAAALFGMKLRSMDDVKDLPWEKVLELAKPGLANDATEDRAEFVGLVEKLTGARQGTIAEPAEIVPTPPSR